MPDKKKDEKPGGGPDVGSGSGSSKRKESIAEKAAAGSGGTKRKLPDSEMSYDPMHFIRSHSKNNDPADIQTQIWEVVFEPDPQNPEKTTSRVATCGGNSICIIDVNTGTVLMKYKHKELK